MKEVRRQLPEESVIYLADQGRLPYGPRPVEEIRRFAEQITRFLLDRQAKVIVVACNTASAAALHHLRRTFPDVPFVGMEPAVKPAAEQTRNKIIGVLATQSTCQSEVFASVVNRFAAGVTVIPRACPNLVTQVEAGEIDSPATEQLLREYLDPMVAAGIDSLVLACTHFAFLAPAIQRIVGPQVRVVDPSPAVARQVARVIAHRGAHQSKPALTALTTGPADPSALASTLIGERIQFASISLPEAPSRSFL